MNTHAHNYYQAGLVPTRADALADALGKSIASRLAEGADDLPHDISERLKAARAQAVAKRKIVSVQTATATAGSIAFSGGEAALQFGDGLGDSDGGWLNRIASLVPLLALVAGLICIAVLQDDMRTRELADVDTELLTDELPPAAFTDPGFVQFLRTNRTN